MNLEIADAEQLLRVISRIKIYIYGVGFIAKKFYDALDNRGLADRIVAFITTEKVTDSFCGKPVMAFEEIKDNLKDDDLICIAVHEGGYRQINELLAINDIINSVWIYPFIHELYLGKVLEENVAISVSSLLKRCLPDYAISIRYLAIEQYFGKNGMGYDLYVRGMELHCSKKTANERLKAFIQLIKNWNEKGYNLTSRLKVTDSGDIIDGYHRLSLALFFGVEEMYCDIYSGNNYAQLFNDNTRISSSKLKMFTTEEEIISLNRVRDYMNDVAEYGLVIERKNIW